MQGIIDRTSYEMSTLDVLTHANGDGSQLPPVAHVGERNGDGEGDGRRLAAAVSMMEAFANGDNMFAVSGFRMAEIASARNLTNRERAARTTALALPTGRIAVGHHTPDLLN